MGFAKCIYGIDDATIDRLKSVLSDSFSEDIFREFLIAADLWKCGYKPELVKHPAYKAEQEVRLIYYPGTGSTACSVSTEDNEDDIYVPPKRFLTWAGSKPPGIVVDSFGEPVLGADGDTVCIDGQSNVVGNSLVQIKPEWPVIEKGKGPKSHFTFQFGVLGIKPVRLVLGALSPHGDWRGYLHDSLGIDIDVVRSDLPYRG